MKAEASARGPQIHLVRGAAPVRIWSRFKKTNPQWSVCGMNGVENVVEDPKKVNCWACLDLMKETKRR